MSKKIFFKIVSLSLIGTSLLSTCAFTETNNINSTSYIKQLYTDDDSNITYEQFEYNGKTVILIKSLTGEVLNTIEEYNNSIYVDGVKIEMDVNNEFDYKNIPKNYEFNNYSRSIISWGKWQTYETIEIKSEIRYGSSENGKYIHYERKSHIYGDGKFVKTLTESGKRAA